MITVISLSFPSFQFPEKSLSVTVSGERDAVMKIVRGFTPGTAQRVSLSYNLVIKRRFQ